MENNIEEIYLDKKGNIYRITEVSDVGINYIFIAKDKSDPSNNTRHSVSINILKYALSLKSLFPATLATKALYGK